MNTCPCCSRSCGRRGRDRPPAPRATGGTGCSRRCAGPAPARALRLPPDRGPGARGQGAGADGDAALPQVPESVDRRQRRADGRRHAPPGPHPHRRRREPGGSARLAGRALRRLRQLQTDRQRHDLAAVRDTLAAARRRGADPAPPAGSPQMTWLLAIVLALAAFALGAFVLGVARRGWTTFAAALALGLAGYALQASPGLPGAPAANAREQAQ